MPHHLQAFPWYHRAIRSREYHHRLERTPERYRSALLCIFLETIRESIFLKQMQKNIYILSCFVWADVAERRCGNRAEDPSGSGEDPAAEGDQTGAAHCCPYRSECTEHFGHKLHTLCCRKLRRLTLCVWICVFRRRWWGHGRHGHEQLSSIFRRWRWRHPF